MFCTFRIIPYSIFRPLFLPYLHISIFLPIKMCFQEASLAAVNEQMKGRIEVGQFVEIYKDVATRPEIYFLMVSRIMINTFIHSLKL